LININSGGNANLFRIPQFLTAPSEERLVQLMLLTNLKNQTEFRYFDIQQRKDGKWVAWFYLEIDKNKIINNALKEDKGR
jgi:hypothetical protein